MPSQRKRIGFLPRAEVQHLIDQICEYNKLSQSKVTGILVEEALTSRGVLNKPFNNPSIQLKNNNDKSLPISNTSFNNENEKINLDKNSIEDEIQMINEFIEFKFFKNVMNKKKEII